MKIFVATIHNPNYSMGPNVRLLSFIENSPKDFEFIVPKFSKKTSKLRTLKVLSNSLFKIIKNRKTIDLIHVVTPPSYPGLVAVMAKKLFKIPYIVDVGDPSAENTALIKNLSEKSWKFKLLKKIDNTVYKNAKHLILTSTELKNFIPTNIPHTTILTPIKEIPEQKPIEVLKSKKCVFLGQYGPLQNIKQIIEIFETAIKKDPEITLDIIGKGDKITVQSPNINFFSPIPYSEIANTLSKYACGVVALDQKNTLDYAIPTKLLTYLANGLVIFGTGGKAVQEMVETSQAGLINKDAGTLENMLKNTEKMEFFSKNALEYAKNNLNPKSAEKAYSQICLQSK
jgi:glycosyltransferase involved in cell wall biosynthesis